MRDQAVFLDQVDHHVPLATVANRARQQVLHESAIEWLIKSINNLYINVLASNKVKGALKEYKLTLEEEVCLLEFVPEK